MSPVARSASSAVDDVLAGGKLRSDYQPIVELDTGAIVAYEALARGPRGSVLESPARLFAAAREAGRLVELDSACQDAALSGARAAGLDAPWTLFINIEPEAAHGAFLPTTTGAAEPDPAFGRAPTESKKARGSSSS